MSLSSGLVLSALPTFASAGALGPADSPAAAECGGVVAAGCTHTHYDEMGNEVEDFTYLVYNDGTGQHVILPGGFEANCLHDLPV